MELEDQSLDVAAVVDHKLSYLAARECSIEVHPELNAAVWVRFDADLVLFDFDEWTRRGDGDSLVLIGGVGVVDHFLDEFVVSDADIVVVLHVLHRIWI